MRRNGQCLRRKLGYSGIENPGTRQSKNRKKYKMKKTIAVLLAIAFVATVAASSFARTLEEEKQAVRDYLKVVDAKIIKFRKDGNTVKMKQMQAEKQGTLRRWEALKAKMEAEEAAAAAPAPAAPAPAPKAAPAAAGMGMCLGVNAGLDAGLFGVAGNLDYDLAGIGAKGLKVRVGGNYVAGTNPTGSDDMKAISVKLGGLYDITDYLSALGMPLSYYVGAAYLLPVKVNAGRTGKWGAEAYLGANYNVPDFGTINAELGYGALKYAETAAAHKGLDLKIGYSYAF